MQITRRMVVRALLERDVFPDYTLLGLDHEFELDLRSLAGQDEGTDGYWAAAKEQILAEGERIQRLVDKAEIDRISVLALARIPLLVATGAVLGEGIDVELYPTRRGAEEGFGWTAGLPVAEFDTVARREGFEPTSVAVIVSVSGAIDPDGVFSVVGDDAAVYEIAARSPGTEAISSQESLDAFAREWRSFLARVEKDHPGAKAISVFPAVGVTSAITMGRLLVRGAHPPLHVYDRTRDGSFAFAMEVTT